MRFAMTGLAAVAAVGMALPAEAELFTVRVMGTITGYQEQIICPIGSSVTCDSFTPYTGYKSSGPFTIDLQQGANPFQYGSPYSIGLFSGTIINNQGVLSGINFGYMSSSCSAGSQPVGCIRQMGSAATFEVLGGLPELGTWLMMLLGFGAVGYAIRRRPTSLRLAM